MPGKGPVPKRSDQRLGHANRAGQAKEISKTRSSSAPTVTWPEPEDLWHPVATRWYLSLRDSGQAVYYEPSDVALAVYVAHAMSDTLLADKMSAVMFANVVSAAGELLTSEGSRRRLRVELQKDVPEDEEQLAVVADIREQRARLRSVA